MTMTTMTTPKTGTRLLKRLRQCLQKKPSIEKQKLPLIETKNSNLMNNLKRAFQSSPELSNNNNNNKFMSSTSTLNSSHLPSPTEPSLESNPSSYSSTSLNTHENPSTTIVLFEPIRVRKPFIFPLRTNTSELAFPLPLQKSRASYENMTQTSSPFLVPIITLTSPTDDHQYALFCPKALDPNPQSLCVPVRASRNRPHPFGPWLRTVGDAHLRTPDEILRLSGDALVGWPVSRSLPPRLMTDAEREAIMLVEKIQRDLEIAHHTFHSHFDHQPWVPEFSEEIDDDDDDDDDDDEEEEEEVVFLYRKNQSNSLVVSTTPLKKNFFDFKKQKKFFLEKTRSSYYPKTDFILVILQN
ncbi:hypothetical protein CROQUDRAFT_504589 [Cronartium quercuum f. sp. fusiforme G11]|uniref:Uncharacterized protein n=1 Tax=Cronartium quercuum f. sp. fusiforme G11 TaxID=708437 RepID=A0A9P6TI91_9BASI|nr:hypothetical protein CROQUDRAFT_504589 [Cronartium quercuum f. sp. fusiforme G11]